MGIVADAEFRQRVALVREHLRSNPNAPLPQMSCTLRLFAAWPELRRAPNIGHSTEALQAIQQARKRRAAQQVLRQQPASQQRQQPLVTSIAAPGPGSLPTAQDLPVPAETAALPQTGRLFQDATKQPMHGTTLAAASHNDPDDPDDDGDDSADRSIVDDGSDGLIDGDVGVECGESPSIVSDNGHSLPQVHGIDTLLPQEQCERTFACDQESGDHPEQQPGPAQSTKPDQPEKHKAAVQEPLGDRFGSIAALGLGMDDLSDLDWELGAIARFVEDDVSLVVGSSTRHPSLQP
ncbi:hypothetical protein BC831DRAFT_471175 [Entophlyctis helioformis]|nr:hypothetical protein BC831DRAFT_471175 [Entophlyctis helioformis]